MSVEHIIPESLGNSKTILPKGTVCDSCNNYFASKVEKFVLESDEFRHLRSNQIIKNKKGKLQEIQLIIDGEPIRARRTDHLEFAIHTEDFDFFEKIRSKGKSEIMIPLGGTPPSPHHMGRFLAKMGLELLADYWSKREGWNDYIVEHEGLDAVRTFARSPKRDEVWEFTKRRIYDEDSSHVSCEGQEGQILYECDILTVGTPESCELFFVVAIFGMEYAINLGGSGMDGYKEWLEENDYVSPLSKKPYVT
ncbi:MAG: hypothetical protein JXR47_04615 [Thiotrichales bacterium]|nr:hypothetical protein [Thiotrichales bacterium]